MVFPLWVINIYLCLCTYKHPAVFLCACMCVEDFCTVSPCLDVCLCVVCSAPNRLSSARQDPSYIIGFIAARIILIAMLKHWFQNIYVPRHSLAEQEHAKHELVRF